MKTAIATHREPQVLQDYQKTLNVALADGTASNDAVIALSIGQQGWLVSLNDLAETSLCPSLAKTGSMPKGVMGIGNFRGRVNTVVSMPRLLGMEGDFRNDGWTTVLHPRFEVAIALWWPQMVGLFSRSDFTKATDVWPLALASRSAWKNSAAGVWNELDTDFLLRERVGSQEWSKETA